VRRPRLLLLDEPFSGADPGLREELGRELSLLGKGLGTTIILVTHDPVEALSLGDRAAVLHKGELLQVGTPAELLEDPADRFVAGLLGWPAMTFLEGVPIVERDAPHFGTGEWQLPVPNAAIPKSLGARLTLGVRPENVRLEQPGDVGTQGTVESVRLLSPTQRLVVVRRGDRQVSALLSGEDFPVEGQLVSVRLDWGRVCWFDPESGRALRAGTSGPNHY
jgi:ABC-type sugar transport system ATPase subunit